MPEHQQTQKSTESKTTSQRQVIPRIPTPVSHPMAIIQRARINPKSLTPADVMQLQRTIGNRAVVRLLTEIGAIPSKAKQAPPVQRQELVQRQEIPEEEEPLQGKFESGLENETCPSCMQRQEIPEEEKLLQGKLIKPIQRQEPKEDEKLQMKSVMQRQEIPEEEEPLQGKLIKPIQRQEIPEEEELLQGKMAETVQRQELPEEEEPLQGKFENKPEIVCPSCFATPIVQRQESSEEEEPLQAKMIGTIQRQEIPEEEEPLQTKRENNTGMPDNLKAGVENLSGIDMSDVRVHYNSSKPAEVGALAYTQGTNIHVAPGKEKHLPHEAWHVVQQKQGRVKPTFQLKEKKALINDDSRLEHEADAMGALTLSIGRQKSNPSNSSRYNFYMSTVMQRATEKRFTSQTINYINAPGVVLPMRVGRLAEAWIDPRHPDRGSEPDPNVRGIYKRYHLIKGHLLNARLGGEGKYYNLFPMTSSMNGIHATYENNVKQWVLMLYNLQDPTNPHEPQYRGRRIHYTVQVLGPIANPMTVPDIRACQIQLSCLLTDATGNVDDRNLLNGNVIFMDSGGGVDQTLENLPAVGRQYTPRRKSKNTQYYLVPIMPPLPLPPGAPPGANHRVFYKGNFMGFAIIS